VGDLRPDGISARAVERPRRILDGVLELLGGGGVVLCQSGDPGREVRDKFHVEHVEDPWSESGLRRGSLYLIRTSEGFVDNPVHRG